MDSKKFDQSIFQIQMKKMQETYALLQDVMPAYFFHSVSEDDLVTILTMMSGLANKPGTQIAEFDDRILMVYMKSSANNPVKTSRFFAGRRIVRCQVHESLPLNDSGDVVVIEQIAKDVPGEPISPIFTYEEIEAEYQRIYGTVPETLKDTVNYLSWRDLKDLDLSRIAARLRLVSEVRARDYSLTEIEKMDGNEYRVINAVSIVARREGFYARSLEQLEANGFKVVRSYLRNFTRPGEGNDFRRKAVRVNTFYIEPLTENASSPENLAKLKRELNELAWSPQFDLFEQEFMIRNEFCCASVNLLRAASEFVHSQLAFVDRDAYTLPEIQRFMATYPDILKQLVDAFESRFIPGGNAAGFDRSVTEVKASIRDINSGLADKDMKVQTVLYAVTDFVCNILKTNYFSENKTALSFALDPVFMSHYRELSDSYNMAFRQERPFGVFFFWKHNACGFHIRFSEIARGGWRTVIPSQTGSPLERDDAYHQASCEIFKECFVLASTQHKKNKDICEGGAKMALLLKLSGEYEFSTELWAAQRAIFEAFLQLINYDENKKLRDKNIVDLTGRSDIIEIGPDENMFDDMISWLGERAEEEGYTLKSGIISGKVDTGINHKQYGVTSFGIFQYLLKTLEYLNIDPYNDDFSVKISGGPFGDVAGNMIKLLNQRNASGKYLLPNLRITAVTDGPAALYDPEGIDRAMLSSLVHKNNLDGFDFTCLKGEGAFMIFNRTDADGFYPHAFIQNGRLITDQLKRDDFMRLYQNNICSQADVFIPCGGRPQTINQNNVADYFIGGIPSSRAIVEGANSFITPEARLTLQKAGTVIVKDSSANKCGVITSSYEILCGLLLEKEELAMYHDELVKEIMDKLELCARREAEWLFREFEVQQNIPMTELSDMLANRINNYKQEIFALLTKKPELVSDDVILAHLPKIFAEKFKERLVRIPDTYRKAITAVETALQIVFKKSQTLENELHNLENRLLQR